jgi:hypothetical protein
MVAALEAPEVPEVENSVRAILEDDGNLSKASELLHRFNFNNAAVSGVPLTFMNGMPGNNGLEQLENLPNAILLIPSNNALDNYRVSNIDDFTEQDFLDVFGASVIMDRTIDNLDLDFGNEELAIEFPIGAYEIPSDVEDWRNYLHVDRNRLYVLSATKVILVVDTVTSSILEPEEGEEPTSGGEEFEEEEENEEEEELMSGDEEPEPMECPQGQEVEGIPNFFGEDIE